MIEMKVEQSIFIGLTAEEIFAYLCDLGSLTAWCGSVVSVRQISPGVLQTGTTMQCMLCFLGSSLDMTFELVECFPARCLTFKSIAGVVPCLFRYQFEPATQRGGTLLTQEAVIHLLKDLRDLEEPEIEEALRRQLEWDLQTLKKLLETRI